MLRWNEQVCLFLSWDWPLFWAGFVTFCRCLLILLKFLLLSSCLEVSIFPVKILFGVCWKGTKILSLDCKFHLIFWANFSSVGSKTVVPWWNIWNGHALLFSVIRHCYSVPRYAYFLEAYGLGSLMLSESWLMSCVWRGLEYPYKNNVFPWVTAFPTVWMC